MKSGNNRVLALASVALSVAMILSAFAVVWLAPRNASPASAQNNDNNTGKVPQITVRGSGSITAKPDMLVVNVGASYQESTIKATQTKVSAAMDAMAAKLKAAGIEEKDYRTVQYTVEPVMDYGSANDKGMMGVPKLTGFRVTSMLEVTFRDPLKAPDVLDQLVSAGANTLYNVGYTFSNPDRLSQQAYENAVKDAEARATRLAGLSNLTLGKVVSVTEANANVPGPVYYDKGGLGAGGASGPIFPGQQSVQVDVIVTYEAK
ncbi:MAG TPA: SIMPL domain-containing protein [Chloroflexia bacterium]|nr:SIMPL domain-containing protein [Chloroflexia bacterium]